jgi:hypothetical protein
LDTLKVYRFIDSTIAYNNQQINLLTNFGLLIDASKIKGINEVYKMMTEMKSALDGDSARAQ